MAVFFLGLFIAVLIGIGIWGMKKTNSLNDFFLGGRNIGPWISAFAYGTTYFSAVVFVGFAGKLGWSLGLDAVWIGISNALIGSLAAWLVLGSRTRRMTQNLDVMTMPEFLQERFGGKFIKIFSAMIIFIFLLPYSASVFKGLGHLFQIYFGIPYDAVLIIMVVITGIYLVLGGYFAVTLTDFFQGCLMIFGVLAMVAFLTGRAGGIFETVAQIRANYPAHVSPEAQNHGLMLVSLMFMTSFGAWGLPQMVQKFYAIKEESMIPKAAIVTTVFALLISGSAYFVGAMSHVFLTPETLPMQNGKVVFDEIIPLILTTHVPNGLMILILLLLLSASMSTLASLILVSASAVAIDLYKGHVNPQVSKERSLYMMRFLSAVFIALSFFIARYQFAVIVTLIALSWGAVAGSFMAPYVYGLYWRRATKWGVKVGMATGLGLSIGLFFAWGPSKSPIASTVAMIVPFFVVPLVSWMTKPPSPHLISRAFAHTGKKDPAAKGKGKYGA